MGDFGGFDPGSFFSGVIGSILDVIGDIINALNFLWDVDVALFDFFLTALTEQAQIQITLIGLVLRSLLNLIQDLFKLRFAQLLKDIADLKKKVTAWIDALIQLMHKLRDLFNKYVLEPMLRTIALIQKIRQFLVIFRLLGFKWAIKLDNLLLSAEQRLVTNVLTLQAYINLALSVLNLIVDPLLILKQNFLLASMLAFLGAVKRVFFFGANRTPSAAETMQAQQDSGALSKGTNLLQSGFGSSAVYYPTVNRILPSMDDAIAYYSAPAPHA